MTNTQPRIGVIGVGTIGQTHIDIWRLLGHEPVAYADTVAESLARQLESSDAKGFADGVELIRSGEVDIVSICTPPLFHKDLAIAAAEAGVMALCEKPLASTLADAEAIAEAVDAHNAKFLTGFCHRYQPAIEKICDMIQKGELGTVITMRNRFAGVMQHPEKTWFSNHKISGGGSLADTTIHSIDMFRYLLGDAVSVKAMGTTFDSNLGPALDVEDTGVILLQNADGAIGVLESSWRTPPGEWAITVYGTSGSVSFDYVTLKLIHRPADGDEREITVDSEDRFPREFAHAIDVWRGDAEPRSSVHDGVAANRILADAYASIGR